MSRLAEYEPKIDPLRDECPVKAALDVIRGRWKPSILFELVKGKKRFSDLQALLPGVTAQALSLQLRQLEAEDIIVRKVFAEVPPRVEYELSEFGLTLSGVFDQLEAWGATYQQRRKSKERQD